MPSISSATPRIHSPKPPGLSRAEPRDTRLGDSSSGSLSRTPTHLRRAPRLVLSGAEGHPPGGAMERFPLGGVEASGSARQPPCPHAPALSPQAPALSPQACPERSRRTPAWGVMPKIVHVDVDAFFASVEQVLNPALRGRPVLVGRGVVASASYEAKALGVKTAMTIRRARELCPQAILVDGRYEHYADYAERIRTILLDFTPAVEQSALDDFYLDFTGTDRLYPDFSGKLRALQQHIQENLGLSVSVGTATSKMVAAIASRLRRPRGFHIVPPGTEDEFLAPLPIEKLFGIGHSHEQVLKERGIRTIGELRRVPRPLLIATFGEAIGSQLYDRARGMDPREVTAPTMPKSISRETTIEGGTIDLDFLLGLIEYLAERVASTLRGFSRQARTLAVRIRYTDFGDAARSTSLQPPTNDEKSLLETAMKIFHALYTRRVAIRFVGVGVANLEPESLQNNLFDKNRNRRWYLSRGVDNVRKKFGWNALFYGNGFALREHYSTERFGLVLSTPCLSR